MNRERASLLRKHWPHGNNQETFSSIIWDRWILRNLYVAGGDAGIFFKQSMPDGFERLGLWPTELFPQMAPPRSPAELKSRVD